MQDAQLDLGHVQPTAVLGRVMKLQLLDKASGFRRLEGFVERTRPVRVEIVEHDADDFRLRVSFIHQPFHLLCKVHFGPLLSDLGVPPTSLPFAEQEEVAREIFLINRQLAIGEFKAIDGKDFKIKAIGGIDFKSNSLVGLRKIDFTI